MAYDKWSDDGFLDLLKQHGDELADETLARLMEEMGVQAIQAVFNQLRSSDDQLPADAPAAFKDFVAATRELPDGVDRERLARLDALLPYGPACCLVMLASSLPQGYSAPRLSRILTISDDLGTHPYKRLLGVLQLLVNLGSRHAFAPGGRAVVTAQKMRLLHAGIRMLVPKYRPDYVREFGQPVSLEDELATLMGFSLLVLEGLKKLGCRMTGQAAEDRYYRWRVYALLMGIHPPGRPDDDSWIPADLGEADRFYASYIRRHFTGPERNPDGVKLSQANLDLMQHLIPNPLRRLGLGMVPQLAMTELLAPEELARTGIPPVVGHVRGKAVFATAVHTFYGLWAHLPVGLVQGASYLMHKGMIKLGRGGEVEFTIPSSLESLRGQGFL
jgi:hypothetical protein